MATPQEQRLRVQAIELKRQKSVLENELRSSGIAPGQRNYLQQRITTLSTEENRLGQQRAQAARQQKQIIQRPVVVTPPLFAVQTQRLQQTAHHYRQRQEEREQTYARLKGQAKKTFILIVIFALLIAAVADILSIVDLGWLISWFLPIVCWFMVRRINGINRSVQQIKNAQWAALGDLRLLRQQLRPALVASGQMQLFLTAESLEIRQAARNYVATFIRDEVITQLIELIPGVDILPLYLAEVVKVIIDQRRAYRRAKEVLVPYRKILDLVTQLEQFDLQYQASRQIMPQRAIAYA